MQAVHGSSMVTAVAASSATPGAARRCSVSLPACLCLTLWGGSRPCRQPFTHVHAMTRVRRSMVCQLYTGGAGWSRRSAAVRGALPMPVVRNSEAATASLALNVAVYNVSCMLERCQAPVATPRAARQARLQHGGAAWSVSNQLHRCIRTLQRVRKLNSAAASNSMS